MALPDRARNFLAELELKGIGQRPIVFVGHSLGGLLIKQLLRAAQDFGRAEWQGILNQTKGVVFLATPHSGSEKANWFSSLASVLGSSVTVAELKEHGPQLRDLRLWYSSNAPRLGITTHVMYETHSTKGVRIVDESSSDPGISNVLPIPVDADHQSICKCSQKSDLVYGTVRKFAASLLSPDFMVASHTPSRKLLVRIDTIGKVASVKTKQATQKAIDRLLEIGKTVFPGGDVKYPKGSLLQASSLSISFGINKPTVALRAAIEFVQAWHRFVLEGEPDCRITIDYATDDAALGSVLSNTETLKLLPAPTIYLSESVVDACDPTLASFTQHCSVPGPPKMHVYKAEFADPRTVTDSSLIHALFIAQPDADEARDRLLELFMAEYLIEHSSLKDFSEFLVWTLAKGYPTPAATHFKELASRSQYFQSAGSPPTFTLTADASQLIERAKKEYAEAKQTCLSTIESEIRGSIRTSNALANIDLPRLVDDYLTAMFLEIRLMANYVRRTSQLFDGSSELLRPLDYIILNQLRDLKEVALDSWRSAFLRGLKVATAGDNAYIAAVFHNVLATYYLNRAPAQKQFQVAALRGRDLYIDTNVLYAALVEASSYHDVINYCLSNLGKLGFKIKIFPFSVREYEQSLARVERGFAAGHPLPWLVSENPWLYQEFKIRQPRYITIGGCRNVHSLVKKERITPDDYDAIEYALASHGIELERDYDAVEKLVADDTWSAWLSEMASNQWDMDRWWSFRHATMAKAEPTIQHDVDLVTNVERRAAKAPPDEFGPRVLLLTLDHAHVLRLRRRYGFIIGVRQCQEFFLPYLFLNDIPVKEVINFPNRLLAAELGTMMATRPLYAKDIVESFLATEEIYDPSDERNKRFPREFRDIATSLNSERFKNGINKLRVLPQEEFPNAIAGVAAAVSELHDQAIARAFDERAAKKEIARLKGELAGEKSRAEKLKKTNRYLREQRQRRP